MLKTHSANGTTCHQCRQKTLDSKTICRSGKCHGLYGQFCAPCLKNRYGEVAQEVILDPNWSCPYCKGRCNCSICRTRQGKRPTGILAPVAFQEGFNGVSEYLDSLDGYGDYSEHTNDDESESLASEETENVDSVQHNNVQKIKLSVDSIGFQGILMVVTDPNTDELLGLCPNKGVLFTNDYSSYTG